MLLNLMLDAMINDINACHLMADYIEEYHPSHPEAIIYINRLHDIKKVRMVTLLEAVAKFGNTQERSEIRKMTKRFLDNPPQGRKSTRARTFRTRLIIYQSSVYGQNMLHRFCNIDIVKA